MSLYKCVFLDRDGVLNRERGAYTYKLEDFDIIEGVAESLEKLKKAGYLLIVITNQGGIAKGIYSAGHVEDCHSYLQQFTAGLIDDIYFCPYHPVSTESLLRKPDSLMLEKAIAKWQIDPSQSFMVGDSERDILAAEKVGVKGVFVGDKQVEGLTAPKAKNLLDAVNHIIL